MGALPPFSARNRGAQAAHRPMDFPRIPHGIWVASPCLPALYQGITLEGWKAINGGNETHWPAFLPGVEMNEDELLIAPPLGEKCVISSANGLYSHLTQDFHRQTSEEDFELVSSRSEAQEYITTELRQLFSGGKLSV